MRSLNSEDLCAITASGMVSSLGCNVETSCAASRAGIVRTSELDYFPTRSPVDGAASGISGHVIPELTRGFEGYARLSRIAKGALSDLIRKMSGAFWHSQRVGFYLSLPADWRNYSGSNLIADKKTKKDMSDKARVMSGMEPINSKITSWFTSLVQATPRSSPPTTSRPFRQPLHRLANR